MNSINDIDIWLIGLEHHFKFKVLVTLIKSPRNLVLRMATYQDWDNFMDFGNLSLYHRIKYE